jgi:hypothetical protein
MVGATVFDNHNMTNLTINSIRYSLKDCRQSIIRFVSGDYNNNFFFLS